MSSDKKKNVTVTIYMDKDKRAAFRLLCTALGTSMNEEINSWIDDFLEKNKGVVKVNIPDSRK